MATSWKILNGKEPWLEREDSSRGAVANPKADLKQVIQEEASGQQYKFRLVLVGPPGLT